MLKVFFTLLPGVSVLPLLYPNLGRERREKILFLDNAFGDLSEPLVDIAPSPESADVLLLPHNFPSVRREDKYLQDLATLAKRQGKPIVVFAHGDSSAPIDLPNVKVFRTSQYRSRLRPEEIIMPPYSPDLLEGRVLSLREKPPAKPVIGFCGWAGYKNTKNFVGTALKNAAVELAAVLRRNPALRARKKGLTFRMQALEILRHCGEVETNFIVRSSYSGHRETIREDPVRARMEYVSTLVGSDLSLVIKGDGNYSYRFTESLSLGRVPLFLDTDTPLPLEKIIPYDRFMIRVPFTDLARIGVAAAEFFRNVSSGEFTDMQRSAREAFERYLKPSAFLRYAVTHLMK